MNIRIGSFSKRHNSTLQPAANWGTLLQNVELKDDSSMEEPVFRLGYSTWNVSYNYIYVVSWNRYYFVTNVNITLGRVWEVECKLDLLGTYKSNVQALNTFVLYASGTNTEIVDHRLSIKTTPTHQVGGYGGFPHVTKFGKYVLTIVGDSTTASYVCSDSDVRNLLASIASWYHNSIPLPDLEADLIAQIKEAGDSIILGIRQLIATGRAGDNIKNAMFIPLSDGAFSGKTTTHRVFMGEYDTGLDLPEITDRHFAESISFNIPWQASDWRKNAPYHELYLVVPTLGVIALSPSDLIDCTTITAELSIDLISGDAKIMIFADGNLNRQIGIYGVNYGAQYAIGASNVNPMSVATSILGAAGAGIAASVSGGAAAASIGVNWVAGTMNNLQPTPTSVGGNGGSAAIGADVRLWLYSIFHDTVVSPSSVSAVMGVPKMATMSLSSHSGYVQTQNASVNGSTMTDAARQEINRMLDSGIYIE